MNLALRDHGSAADDPTIRDKIR